MNNTTTTAATTTTFNLLSKEPADLSWRRGDVDDDGRKAAPATCEVEVATSDIETMLHFLYEGQGNNINGTKFDDTMCTLSVGDIAFTAEWNNEGQYLQYNDIYAVAPMGFIKITVNILRAWEACDEKDRSWLIRDLLNCKKVS